MQLLRKTYRWLRTGVGLFLFLAVLCFSVTNRDRVSFDLFPLPYVMELPKYIFVLGFFALGLIVCAMLGGAHNFRMRRLCRRYARRLNALENEVIGLRADADATQTSRHAVLPSA